MIEVGVLAELCDNLDGVFWCAGTDLQAEPFVHHKAVVFPLFCKGSQFIRAMSVADQGCEGCELLGHIVRSRILGGCLFAAIEPGEQPKDRIPQGAFTC